MTLVLPFFFFGGGGYCMPTTNVILCVIDLVLPARSFPKNLNHFSSVFTLHSEYAEHFLSEQIKV